MNEYRVSARVVVEVVMTIEADNEDAAQKLFEDKISMQADLVEYKNYFTEEDGISEIHDLEVTEQ